MLEIELFSGRNLYNGNRKSGVPENYPTLLKSVGIIITAETNFIPQRIGHGLTEE